MSDCKVSDEKSPARYRNPTPSVLLKHYEEMKTVLRTLRTEPLSEC